MGQKIKFSRWQDRLESIMCAEYGAVVSYDEDLAKNAWREGDGPQDFFKEFCQDSVEREEFNPLIEL